MCKQKTACEIARHPVEERRLDATVAGEVLRDVGEGEATSAGPELSLLVELARDVTAEREARAAAHEHERHGGNAEPNGDECCNRDQVEDDGVGYRDVG